MTTALAVLEYADALLADETCWTKGYYKHITDGKCTFCLKGAMYEAGDTLGLAFDADRNGWVAAYRALQQACEIIGGKPEAGNIVVFNDAFARFADVKAALAKAKEFVR
jgi:hypothetical protein